MRRQCLFSLLLLFLVFDPFLLAQEDTCEEGWIAIAGKCYLFENTTTTVFGSRSRCAAWKARLSVFHNVLEYKRFNETLTNFFPNLTVPLGLQLLEGQWTWTSDGSTTENVYWQTGVLAPHNDSLRRCIVRTDIDWQTVHCEGTSGITPVCQMGTISLSITEIPCAPLYRFGYGWQHLLTTNAAEAVERGFTLNQTLLLGETLYAATIYIPGVTQPLYEVQNPKTTHTSMVNTDSDLHDLMTHHNFTIRGIIGYTLANAGFADTTVRHLSWSSDVPGDTVISDDIEHTKYMVNWNWKAKPPLYFFNKTFGLGVCRAERNCSVSEWSDWSNCSSSCGNATRTRSRNVTADPVGQGSCPQTHEEESCAFDACPSIHYVGLTPELVSALEDHGILDAISDQQSLVASVTNAVVPAVFASQVGDNHGAGHQLNETVEFCMYDDQPCDEQKLFATRLNPFYGNCFTFNPRENELNVTRGGPQGGLRLLLRVQQHEYYPCTQTAGFKVYMHPADEYPFIETYGYNMAPGLVTSMAISMAKLEKKDTPQSPCTDSWDNPKHPGITYYYNGSYNPEGCIKSCLQDYIIQKCGCADPRYARPSNISFCSDLEDVVLGENGERNYSNVRTLCPDYYQNTTCKKDYLKDANCHCISQCERTYYDAVVNTALLLSNRHIEEVACEELNYTEGCAEAAIYHFALLEIYYERLQSVTFHEEEAKTIWDLLQDMSNMMQNINGFDFFTIFEVGFLIAEIINLTCFGKRKKRKMRRSRLPLVRLLADDTTMTDFLFFLFTFCGSLMLLAFLYSSKVLEIRW